MTLSLIVAFRAISRKPLPLRGGGGCIVCFLITISLSHLQAVLSMWKFKAELKQTYFVSATSNHLPDQGGVLMCFVCTWTGCFICKQPRMIVCVSLFELKLFKPPTPLPPISRSLYCCNLVLVFSLLASRIFSKGGTMFIFRHFPLTAVNPREGHLLASLNCSARCLFTLLKSPISHLGPHFFIGTVFGQASQVTMVSLF